MMMLVWFPNPLAAGSGLGERRGVRGAQLCVSVIIGIILHEEYFHHFQPFDMIYAGATKNCNGKK